MKWLDDEWGSHATLPAGITLAVTRRDEGFEATANRVQITHTPPGKSPRVTLFDSMDAAKSACVGFLRSGLADALAALEDA